MDFSCKEIKSEKHDNIQKILKCDVEKKEKQIICKDSSEKNKNEIKASIKEIQKNKRRVFLSVDLGF